MSKFYVNIILEVEADNVDEARALAYDMYNYGASSAEDDSESGYIIDYNIEVEEE